MIRRRSALFAFCFCSAPRAPLSVRSKVNMASTTALSLENVAPVPRASEHLFMGLRERVVLVDVRQLRVLATETAKRLVRGAEPRRR